jgi:hypothetical protein
MPTDDRSAHGRHSADVAFLVPIVRRLGVEEVCRLAGRAGDIVAREAAAEAADAVTIDLTAVLPGVGLGSGAAGAREDAVQLTQ